MEKQLSFGQEILNFLASKKLCFKILNNRKKSLDIEFLIGSSKNIISVHEKKDLICWRCRYFTNSNQKIENLMSIEIGHKKKEEFDNKTVFSFRYGHYMPRNSEYIKKWLNLVFSQLETNFSKLEIIKC